MLVTFVTEVLSLHDGCSLQYNFQMKCNCQNRAENKCMTHCLSKDSRNKLTHLIFRSFHEQVMLLIFRYLAQASEITENTFLVTLTSLYSAVPNNLSVISTSTTCSTRTTK